MGGVGEITCTTLNVKDTHILEEGGGGFHNVFGDRPTK